MSKKRNDWSEKQQMRRVLGTEKLKPKIHVAPIPTQLMPKGLGNRGQPLQDYLRYIDGMSYTEQQLDAQSRLQNSGTFTFHPAVQALIDHAGIG